jgi:diacylglycerol kinase family enzyme
MENGRGAPLTVILNPAAGSSAAAAEDRILKALSEEGFHGRVRVVRPDTLADEVRKAARAGDLVAVAGGDGTLSTAAEIIAESGAILAPFPLGTLNHFARRLGIRSPEAAARAVTIGLTLRAPIGSVGGRTFIHHASAGMYPRMVRQRDRIRRWSGKRVGTVVAGAYAVLRLDARPISIRVDGATQNRTTPGLWVGLGRGSFRLPVDSHPPMGRSLEVIVPDTRSRARFVMRSVRALWRMRRGQPLQMAGVEVIHTTRFTLEADEPVDVSRDGEVERCQSPIEFRLHPEALRVLALAEDR